MAKKSIKEEGKFESAGEVLEIHESGKAHYRKAALMAEEIENLVFGEWQAPIDIADIGYQPHRPSKPRSIVDNFRRSITAGIGADMEIKVLPLSETVSEQKNATKLEWWLSGMDRRLAWESDRDYRRDAAFWYVFRGRACFEQRIRPEYRSGAGGEAKRLGVEVMCDDPKYIYPRRGRKGIRYYTKEYEVSANELRDDVKGKGRKLAKKLEEAKDDDVVTVVEYCDDRYYACVALGELLYNARHDYGFVPLSEAHCMDTPLASANYMYQGVLGSVMDDLKMQAELAEKMRAGLKLFFYPMMYYESVTGQPVVFDPFNMPAVMQQIGPGSKIQIINVNVNHQIFQQLMAYAQGQLNLGTMPESTFGTEPKGLESGFAIAQVLSQSRMSVIDKLPNLERAMGKNYSQVLRLIEQYGDLEGMDLEVPVDYDD